MAAKRGKKSKGKRGKPKVSLTKLSNKQLNKLAKQGKLKKRIPKSQYLRLLQERTQPKLDPEEAAAKREAELSEEKDIPLEEADYDYFAKPNRNYSFLKTLSESHEEEELRKKRKRKKVKDDEEDSSLENAYEQSSKRRNTYQKITRDLLPIKGKEGVLPQSVEQVESEDEEIENGDMNEADNVEKEEEEKTLPSISVAKLFALRQEKLSAKKQKIAVLCSSVIENPEENYGKLKDIRMFLEENEVDIQITVKKWAMISLMEIFKDIIPGYKIRIASEKEKQQSATKETKKLRAYEEGLLNNYRNYLRFMESIIQGKTPKSKNKKVSMPNGVQIIPEAQQGLKEVAIKCMSELLITHPHFNFRTNIISVILPVMVKGIKLSEVICNYVKRIFKEDKAGEVTLEIVRLMGRMIKAKKYNVQPQVLQTLLSLKIKKIENPEDKIDKATRREKIRKMSRKERKRLKQMSQLEKELQTVSAETDKRKTLRIHTEIINMVFLIYFRILKTATESGLLSAVLEGLAKHAHLINVDYFEDLFTLFNQLIDSNELSNKESLFCIKTAFTVLTGQGIVLNIDPLRFYKHLYKTLFKLHAGKTCEDLPIALDCLDLMISKRRKQVSHHRILAFIKRLATLSLHLEPHGALGALAATRVLLHTDIKSDILFDIESQGSGFYLAEIDDPEHCNVNNTALWELHPLQHHYHSIVRKYADHLCAKAPSQGSNQLASNLSRKMPVELFYEYDANTMDINHLIPRASFHQKKKSTRTGFYSKEIVQMIQQVTDAAERIHISKVDFSQTNKNAMQT